MHAFIRSCQHKNIVVLTTVGRMGQTMLEITGVCGQTLLETVLAAADVASVAVRPFRGWMADRWDNPVKLMGL